MVLDNSYRWQNVGTKRITNNIRPAIPSRIDQCVKKVHELDTSEPDIIQKMKQKHRVLRGILTDEQSEYQLRCAVGSVFARKSQNILNRTTPMGTKSKILQ